MKYTHYMHVCYDTTQHVFLSNKHANQTFITPYVQDQETICSKFVT